MNLKYIDIKIQINIKMAKLCKKRNCRVIASYGVKYVEYCRAHKKANMVLIRKQICKYQDCLERANYGFDKAEYCRVHKLDGMFMVYHKLCQHTNCSKTANFGVINGEKQFCKKHAITDSDQQMINLNRQKGKICEWTNCDKHASFGHNIIQYCGLHKNTGMINLRLLKYKCIDVDCNKQACFGFLTQKPQYCRAHKHSDMINLRVKLCEKCESRATFNYVGKSPRFCSVHREINMINHNNKSVKLEKLPKLEKMEKTEIILNLPKLEKNI